MNSQFNFLGKTFALYRYPKHLSHPSWQAWDSADELLIEHLEQAAQVSATSRMLIFNDSFGALTCWFQAAQVFHVTDSYVSQLACQQNLAANQTAGQQTAGQPPQYLSSLSPLPSEPDIVLLKIPKTSALLEQQLIDLQACVSPDTQVIAAGKAKAIQKSTLAMFEKYLGKTHTSLAKKKSRLIFCQPRATIKPCPSPYPTSWQSDDGRFELHNHANVFSRGQMDIGARLLFKHLPDCSQKTVIDLGCGNGIIGLYALADANAAKLYFVDESHMAVDSAKHNVSHNLPEAMSRCEFVLSDSLQQFPDHDEVDIVICNPPFHQQNTITDHIAEQMFSDAHQRLKKGGELRIIGNRHLDYPQKLKRIFGGYKVITSDRKFSIMSAIK